MLRNVFLLILMMFICFPAMADSQDEENRDGDFEELNAVLDETPTVDIKLEDLKFEDGESIIEFLKKRDPKFLERNKEFLKGFEKQ